MENDVVKIVDILSNITEFLVYEEFVEFVLDELNKSNVIENYQVETSTIVGFNLRQLVKRI